MKCKITVNTIPDGRGDDFPSSILRLHNFSSQPSDGPAVLANIVGQGTGGCHPPYENLEHYLFDLLLIVDLYTHPSSFRIQFKTCQYL